MNLDCDPSENPKRPPRLGALFAFYTKKKRKTLDTSIFLSGEAYPVIYIDTFVSLKDYPFDCPINNRIYIANFLSS